MKPIELTNVHKAKLLEMCKVLFPIEYGIFIGNDGMISLRGLGKQIHWFEFCMTHLRTKLNLHHDDLYLTTNPNVNTFTHPVDYLYSQFKKRNKPKERFCHECDSYGTCGQCV